MLSLSKKTDYALIALAYMAERQDRVVSAREIATAYEMPLALLMNILKTLQQARILSSTRGVKGGYRLAANVDGISLYDLTKLFDPQEDLDEVVVVEETCQEADCRKVSRSALIHPPVQALQYKLLRFIREVKVADLILPGRRIDVPLELVGVI